MLKDELAKVIETIRPEYMKALCSASYDLDIKFATYKLAQAISDYLAKEGYEKKGGDDVFIQHIQSHLQKGQEVICKICGKTAKEIIALKGAELIKEELNATD